MPREADPLHLHPAFRRPALALEAELSAAGIPLRLYEGARSPFRQAELFAIGRAAGCGEYGKTKTRSLAWESYHQFAVAADFVFLVNGKWTWEEPRKGMWAEFQARATKVGLRFLSFEKPHVELTISLSALQRGVFPDDGGDSSWRDWMEGQVEIWGCRSREVNGIVQPGAPSALLSLHDRPTNAA